MVRLTDLDTRLLDYWVLTAIGAGRRLLADKVCERFRWEKGVGILFCFSLRLLVMIPFIYLAGKRAFERQGRFNPGAVTNLHDGSYSFNYVLLQLQYHGLGKACLDGVYFWDHD